MRVMVTGGSGHIGRRAVARLAPGHSVLVVDRAEWRGPVEADFLRADLTSPAALDAAPDGLDAIVHLAAIPNPSVGPWDEVLRVNMLSTFNVLRFAVSRGIRRVVFGSSESASGWGIHGKWYRPDYLPIDERHVSLPSEVYSFTKAFGDQLCQGFSREHGLETVCLRYTFVTYAANYPGFLPILRSAAPRDATGTLYAWIDVEDVAAAVDLALDVPLEAGQSETFYLTADDHYGAIDSRELIRRNWGGSVRVDEDYFGERPRRTLFDTRKAKRLLGWQPQWTVERLLAEHGTD